MLASQAMQHSRDACSPEAWRQGFAASPAGTAPKRNPEMNRRNSATRNTTCSTRTLLSSHAASPYQVLHELASFKGSGKPDT